MELKSLFNRKTFLKRTVSLLTVGAAAVAFQGVAYAHHPHVESATPACVNGKIVINFTITSWDPTDSVAPGSGENSNVQVLFDGNMVASGMFADATGNMFSGQAPVGNIPSPVIVSALAVGFWGDTSLYPPNGFPGGELSDNTISVDYSTITNCGTPPLDGRFTGGGKVVVSNAIVPASGSVTVTKGFEVECDLDPAHENLELNWTGANNFHMDTITFAHCTLPGDPTPPKANVNQIDASGTGKFNGTPGYTVVFTLIDNGEPGVADEAGFVVCLTDPINPNSCSTSTSIVLSVPVQPVSTGNIQAHLDQGH
jgi:hypothetical protein